MSVIIFAGPSLPPASRPAVPGAIWLGPARMGDVRRAAEERPDAIGLIDGYFEVVPSVWHEEILWAMDRGIRVYGAASIGALRAAELDVYGMIGVGRIYEAFRDGALEDDDEVALLHGPEEMGYLPLTEAMVNIRATMDEAVRIGVLTAEAAERAVMVAKALFYKQRTYSAILRIPAAEIPIPSLNAFNDWLGHGRQDRKRTDAVSMVRAIALLARRPPGH
jgi:hypothetical protein